MPDPAPPPRCPRCGYLLPDCACVAGVRLETSGYWHDVTPQWEALQRREVAHLLLGMVPTSFEDAMRKVAELERRGIFVVRAADA